MGVGRPCGCRGRQRSLPIVLSLIAVGRPKSWESELTPFTCSERSTLEFAPAHEHQDSGHLRKLPFLFGMRCSPTPVRSIDLLHLLRFFGAVRSRAVANLLREKRGRLYCLHDRNELRPGGVHQLFFRRRRWRWVRWR